MGLVTLKVRKKFGAEVGLLEATDLEQAGRAYCQNHAGCTYISVTSAILADAAILNAAQATVLADGGAVQTPLVV